MNDDAILTSTEAREEFGWSRDLMTRLLRSGALPYTTDPLDKRLKWVKRSDVTRLNEASRRQRRLQPLRAGASGRSDVPGTTAPAAPAASLFPASAVSPTLSTKSGKTGATRTAVTQVG